MAMDETAKSLTENLTGKGTCFRRMAENHSSFLAFLILTFCGLTTNCRADYEPGDLSKEIDTRVKQKVAEFAGKDSYEFGELPIIAFMDYELLPYG